MAVLLRGGDFEQKRAPCEPSSHSNYPANTPISQKTPSMQAALICMLYTSMLYTSHALTWLEQGLPNSQHLLAISSCCSRYSTHLKLMDTRMHACTHVLADDAGLPGSCMEQPVSLPCTANDAAPA
eukprot:1156793-Pelagomonas_calceolata.AAC.3